MIRKYSFVFPVHAISKDNDKSIDRYGRRFVPRKFKNFENTLALYFRQQVNPGFKRFETEELCVSLDFVFKNRIHGDIGNLPKSVLDSMNELLYKDDRQIKSLYIGIGYGKNEEIRLEVFNME